MQSKEKELIIQAFQFDNKHITTVIAVALRGVNTFANRTIFYCDGYCWLLDATFARVNFT